MLTTRQLSDVAKIKTVLNDEDPSFRRVVLRVKGSEELPEQTREYLASLGATYAPFEAQLGYDHWTARMSRHYYL